METTSPVKITEAHVVEGNLYEFAGEDCMKVTFDCRIIATGTDGKTYMMDQIFAGKGFDPDTGFDYVINSREDANAVLVRVLARGCIRLAFWTEYVEEKIPSLEERLADEAWAEQEEARR